MKWFGAYPALIALFLVIAALAGVQALITYQSTAYVERIDSELGALKPESLKTEKSRQEIIGLRIKNESQKLFWGRFLRTFGPFATTFVALLGALVGLRKYLDTRERERLDHASTDLKGILQHTADENPRLRIVGIVGLQHFFTTDKKEYHLRALSSLVAAARIEKDKEVLRNVRIAVREAIGNLDVEVIRQVTWQDVTLNETDFSNQTLQGADFRDANLEDANFEDCRLEDTHFINAHLNGSCFDGANLEGANLTYADLAGASFIGANLRKATLQHTKVLRMNIRRADLRDASFDIEKMPWPLIIGWREAVFDVGIREQLLAVHGPAPSGIRIMMLMWEIPPLVAGGTWTATYHLVRNLQKRGVHLTIVVPWDESLILPNPFGCDVDIVPLGIFPPDFAVSPYAQTSGSLWSSYGYQMPPSPYGHGSPYSCAQYASPYGYEGAYHPYVSVSPYSVARVPRRLRFGVGILRVAEEFKRRFVRFARNEQFDIIHAHDWVTFEAAQAAAEKLDKLWVAHFHSTEFERRPTNLDNVIIRLEQQGISTADKIVVPSRSTAPTLTQNSRVNEGKITVMRNPLSKEDIEFSRMGDFESRRIVFSGRLTPQKGPDLFAKVANYLHQQSNKFKFWVYGSGEFENQSVLGFPIIQKGHLEWQNRGEAFNGASAILVTSRAEPFGMVVLEAMQYRVPVFYPKEAGVSEVIQNGVKINPNNLETTAATITAYLNDWDKWEQLVEDQAKEIEKYIERRPDSELLTLWNDLHAKGKNQEYS